MTARSVKCKWGGKTDSKKRLEDERLTGEERERRREAGKMAGGKKEVIG